MSSSPIEVPETEWTGPAAEDSGERCYTRKLAALTTIESAQGESSYSFSGVLRYRVSEAGDAFEVQQYDIRGIPLDGPDFGVIEYRGREPWRVEIDADRRFTIRSSVAWRDQHNGDASMDLVLRGNLLENHAIAYLSSTICGALELGGAGEVHMTTPACW
jgi:hypothetical protein